MGGLSQSVPVKKVPAAQSPLNIMQEIVRNSPGYPASQPPIAKRLTSHNLHYVCAPAHWPRWGAAAQGCAFCCQPLSQSLANTAHKRQRPATVQPAGFFFSCPAPLRPTTLKAGRPAASVNFPPPPRPCGDWLRAARSRLRSLLVAVLAIAAPCSPRRGLPLSKAGSCKAVPNLKRQ
ncbi:hypothetical protein Xcab_04177 [Xenorhabdus cabanillasii JM26]|nr:hypothetical protein Xcab_04177 [Xenorhabdus cabanillasii JM26]